MPKKKKQDRKIKGPKYQRYLGNIREDYLIKEFVQALGTKICFTNESVSTINLIQSNMYNNDLVGDYGIFIAHKLLSNHFLSSIEYKEAKFGPRYNLEIENKTLLVKDWNPRKRHTKIDEILDQIPLSDGELIVEDYNFYAYREPYKNCIEEMLLKNNFQLIESKKQKSILSCYANHIKIYDFPQEIINNISIDNQNILE